MHNGPRPPGLESAADLREARYARRSGPDCGRPAPDTCIGSSVGAGAPASGSSELVDGSRPTLLWYCNVKGGKASTNLPFEQWTEVCGSERLTGAILDRLTHHVHILEANGDSYRLKESERRRTQDKAHS